MYTHGVFCNVDSFDFLPRGIYLFESEQAAKTWMVERIHENCVAEQMACTIHSKQSVKRKKKSTQTDDDLIEDFQLDLDLTEWFHCEELRCSQTYNLLPGVDRS